MNLLKWKGEWNRNLRVVYLLFKLDSKLELPVKAEW
jgi:hypothetical protein